MQYIKNKQEKSKYPYHFVLQVYQNTLKQLYINNKYLFLNRGLRSIAWLV
jgi:hypothetical protein